MGMFKMDDIKLIVLWDTTTMDANTTPMLMTMQIVSMMRSVPATEDDKLAKAALFTKYVEVLPHALRRSLDCGINIILDLLAGIQAVVAGDPTTHQILFRWGHSPRRIPAE